tara:strand:+ start:2898 stop:3389 length:492 start_codon:yes stop_codon:yes gene_type:complete
MTDITYTNTATERTDSTGTIAGKGNANAVQKLVCASVELAASASGVTVKLGRIKSDARIMATGLVYNDDLATSGSPTLDIGLGSVDSNITSDPDALNNGIALSSATSTTTVIADAANVGKRAWEFVSGQTTDPGGFLDVYATVKDAATTATGTVAVEMTGYFD